MKTNRHFGSCLAFAAVLSLLTVGSAHAQFTLTFAPLSPTVAQGSTLTLAATLRNLTGSAIDLSSASAGGNFTGPSAGLLTLNDIDFQNNLPISLANNTSYVANVFVSAASTATLGTYTLSYSVDNGSGLVAQGTSSVRVTAPSTSAPEAGSLLLGGLAIPVLGIAYRRRLAK